MGEFANRIIRYGTKPASQFEPNPANPRIHPQKQRNAMREALERIGWISTVIENRTTGHLVDGHERVWQALKNDEEVPYVQVELSEEDELLALATFDPLGMMAEYDRGMLESLLMEVEAGESELNEMLAVLAESEQIKDGDTMGDNPPVVKLCPHCGMELVS